MTYNLTHSQEEVGYIACKKFTKEFRMDSTNLILCTIFELWKKGDHAGVERYLKKFHKQSERQIHVKTCTSCAAFAHMSLETLGTHFLKTCPIGGL
jgi:hypothetical protein